MYCKKCGKDYPKDKKICKDCGIALSPGHPHSPDKNSKLRFIIICCVVGALILAAFLIIGIPSVIAHQEELNLNKIKGTWYDQAGSRGIIQFEEGGKAKWTEWLIFDNEYQYTYDGQNGTLSLNGQEFKFTCDGTTLSVDGATFTKNYVEQEGLYPDVSTSK